MSEYQRLMQERERLIADGVDPRLLIVPLNPDDMPTEPRSDEPRTDAEAEAAWGPYRGGEAAGRHDPEAVRLDVERLTMAARLVPEQDDFDLWVKKVADEYDRLARTATDGSSE